MSFVPAFLCVSGTNRQGAVYSSTLSSGDFSGYEYYSSGDATGNVHLWYNVSTGDLAIQYVNSDKYGTVYTHDHHTVANDAFPFTRSTSTLTTFTQCTVYKAGKYTLSRSTTGGGTGGDVSASGTNISLSLPGSVYPTSGTSITFSASPRTGYAFDAWYVDGAEVSSTPSYTLTSTLDTVAVQAVFVPTSFTLTVTAGTGGTAASVPASGTKVDVGAVVTITAVPAYNYVFSAWSGISGAGEEYSFYMPESAVTTAASFTIRPSYALSVTKENGTFGTVALTSETAPDAAEVDGAINVTGYTDVEYTLTAMVTDTDANVFAGWYEGETLLSREAVYTFTQTEADALSIVAKFSARPAYTIEQRVSDGSATTWNAGNPAYDAGCRIATSKASDLQSPDRWYSGSISFTATAAEGWQLAGWYIADASGVESGTSIESAVNPLTFSLAYNTILTARFTRINHTASVTVGAATNGKGTASVTYDSTSGTSVQLPYGETAVFTATPVSGYGFKGWYRLGDVGFISTANPYSPVIESDLALIAIFSMNVTLTVAHTVAADDTGTVNLNPGTANETTAGATSAYALTFGASCVINAIGTAGSIFDAWYLTSDTGFEHPLEGYTAQTTITPSENTALTARFFGASDIEDRYLAILNYDNNETAYDPSLGVLASSAGTEITQAEWEEFTGSPISTGTPVAGNKFYKFTGTQSTTLTALPNSALGFMKWTSKYLIRIVPTPEVGQPQFTASSPADIGTATVTSVVLATNRHYIITAVWGEPVAVDVSLRYAAGCDESNGAFTMSPETEDRATIQGGVTDKYMQGDTVTLSADVGNGYLFSGWYYDRAATQLASASTVFTHTVVAPAEFFAKFTPDANAIYMWEGGTENKKFTWRSKRYKATRPFNPASARVYGDAYPVMLRLYMSSSPESPSATTPTVSLYSRNQDGFRLPMARPEKYLEIEVSSTSDVSEVAVATSMGGLV